MAEADWVIGRSGDGVPVVRFVRGEREGRPWADLLEVLDGSGGVDPVEFVRTEMPGWVVSGSERFGRELLSRGATVLRHAHTLRRDLVAAPPPADWAGTPLRSGLRATACDRAPEDLFEAWRAAFAPGHVDRFAGDDRQALAERLVPLLAGKAIGPVLPSSRLAVDADHRVVAGVVLTDRDGVPWIADVFRHPERGYRGLGADLLRQAVADATRSGLTEVQLTVTEGNPARRLYESLGFELLHTALTVIVPKQTGGRTRG
ncbi:GNAT family N-acetyltransferase [Streptomyces kaniharaensis]|uniref:GNAT family N-acetyltransferase n=1 Tax=Streptomyces kaniharaensis TaxID=212423 RepID=A0A6N7KJG9_9ACTN|nr:GNAT family N-acetyltransferase [Streptomyces kaniharaensis]MQS11576.1 GNAT family N-acetyltransferase [Streptomyces kaniharaensis]